MYHLREILIALCMPLYDIDYLNPFNFGRRLWVIHHHTNYYKVKAPIFGAAKHCARMWHITIINYQLPDTDEEGRRRHHDYFPM